MSSGEGRSAPCRTPPSTTRPPSANVHIPTEERAARPAASARARRVDRAPVQRGQRLGHGERELRARAEPDVRRDRLDDAQMPAARKPQRVTAAPRERQRALRVGALHGQLVRRLGLEHDRRAADRHPEPAEAARAVAGGREHAQVQARGRLDADRHGSPTTPRT